MSDLLPFYVGIGVFSCMTGYQVYLSRTFQGNYREKLYFYHSHLITVIPIVLYLFNIFQTSIAGRPIALDFFYIEWALSTPLLLMNLGRLLNTPLPSYIFLSIMDLAIILCGYISYLSKDPTTYLLAFGIGCGFYLLLMGFFLKALRTCQRKPRHTLPPTSIYRDSLRYRIFRALLAFLVFSWNIYPCIHILYKEGYITVQQCCIAYICLDLGVKGIFTNLLLGSRELYTSTPSSWIGRVTKKVLRVHPLQQAVSHHMIEDMALSGRGIVVHPTSWIPTLESIQEDRHIEIKEGSKTSHHIDG